MVFQRRFFTLMELLIAIAILAMASVVVGINVRKALKEQRFLSEVQQVVSELQLAQDLMLILKTDSVVTLFQDKDGIHTSLQVEKVISKNWLNQLNRPRKVLTTVKSIKYNDKELDDGLSIKLNFLSGGLIMSRGELVLSGEKEDSLQRKICLHGYPRPIYSITNDECLLDLPTREESMKLYPQDVLPEAKDSRNSNKGPKGKA